MASEGATRIEQFPSGIVGVSMGEVERRIPADEPPPLPVNAELKVIGKPARRVNGREKVTGAIRYTVDVNLPGMLFARLKRSPHPSAEVRAIDVSAAQALPGVRAVVVLAKPGDSSRGFVRYVGQPVAAVAAVNPAIAEEALSRIRVDYRPRPFVVDLDAAMAPDAPKVFAAEARAQRFGRKLRHARSAARRQRARTVASFSAATPRPGSPPPTSLSKANIARRCRRIAAWSRTASSPIGATTG